MTPPILNAIRSGLRDWYFAESLQDPHLYKSGGIDPSHSSRPAQLVPLLRTETDGHNFVEWPLHLDLYHVVRLTPGVALLDSL